MKTQRRRRLRHEFPGDSNSLGEEGRGKGHKSFKDVGKYSSSKFQNLTILLAKMGHLNVWGIYRPSSLLIKRLNN